MKNSLIGLGPKYIKVAKLLKAKTFGTKKFSPKGQPYQFSSRWIFTEFKMAEERIFKSELSTIREHFFSLEDSPLKFVFS